MARYFLEVAYKGTNYSGFQIQQNANTIQAEVEKAFQTLQRTPVLLTGSSRTDAGVHALQNFFHFDYHRDINTQFVYKMNAILPKDIVIKNLYMMAEGMHSRFDASCREYIYRIHQFKNPFLAQTSFFYPYKIDFGLMQEGASFLKTQQSFFSFSKTNTQVNNFNCIISKSRWIYENDELLYNIEANRFLRGMVRLITSTLLQLGRGKISSQEFQNLFTNQEKCGCSIPAHGLSLIQVTYPQNYFNS